MRAIVSSCATLQDVVPLAHGIMLPPEVGHYGKDGVEESMPELTKYHLSEHRADALLQPLDLQLDVLETRVKHYLDRLHMTADDRTAIEAAYKAVQAAHAEVTRQLRARAVVPQQSVQGGK
jgi:hypothetical protein